MVLADLYGATSVAASIPAPAERLAVINEVIDQLNAEFPAATLNQPTPADRAQVTERTVILTSNAFRRRNQRPGASYESELAAEIARRLLGLGFLDLLLPPARTDLSEITVYSSGLVQVMKKGAVRFETIDLRPEAGEIWRVLDRLLGPQNRVLNESNPSVNAKLPATEANPGGGRIKVLHPVIAPPGRNPSINIRLYEQKPVLPEWLIQRNALSAEMMADLRLAMESGKRLLIAGGTRTGKTTLLSALCNFLPEGWRIVKIEDPEEIWIDRKTVQTVEARPQAVGTEVSPYTLADGVDDAMRMSPDYLIIGEARDGRAVSTLFRALMTGHSGACTFHAESPRDAARRLANNISMDMGVSNKNDVYEMIATAIDVYVQISIRHERRVITSIANVAKEVRGGNVVFENIWRYDETSPAGAPRWEKLGELKLHHEEL